MVPVWRGGGGRRTGGGWWIWWVQLVGGGLQLEGGPQCASCLLQCTGRDPPTSPLVTPLAQGTLPHFITNHNDNTTYTMPAIIPSVSAARTSPPRPSSSPPPRLLSATAHSGHLGRGLGRFSGSPAAMAVAAHPAQLIYPTLRTLDLPSISRFSAPRLSTMQRGQ